MTSEVRAIPPCCHVLERACISSIPGSWTASSVGNCKIWTGCFVLILTSIKLSALAGPWGAALLEGAFKVSASRPTTNTITACSGSGARVNDPSDDCTSAPSGSGLGQIVASAVPARAMPSNAALIRRRLRPGRSPNQPLVGFCCESSLNAGSPMRDGLMIDQTVLLSLAGLGIKVLSANGI